MAVKSESISWSPYSESTFGEQFPLHRACRDGDATVLSKLLQEYKASANEHLFLEDTYYGWSPSHWAAYFGKLDCLRVLVLGGTVGNNTPTDMQTSRFKQAPSHIAAFAGHPQCLQWLLQAGANPNSKDYLGESPLHKAVRAGSMECTSLLVNSRAQILLKNHNNETAVDLAIFCGHSSVVQYLNSLLPKEEIKPLISANGYYGFHLHSNGHSGGNQNTGTTDSESSSMDIDSETVPATQMQPSQTNGHSGSNGIISTNGFVSTNTFGSSLMRNEDITLSMDISQNRIPIGGKKRSREEVFIPPQMKRSRVEENAFHSKRRFSPPLRRRFSAGVQMSPDMTWTTSSTGIPSPAINNNCTIGRTPCSLAECSVREHYETVRAEKGYDTLKYQVLMADAHGC